VSPDADLLTIEQLAAHTGLTVRNIRSHVTRGLLPPPHLRGRTGYYGREHVARLQLITALQQQGFNLTAIQRLVSGPAAPSAEETVAFYRAALGPWLAEPPEERTASDLAREFGVGVDDSVLARLEQLGLLERLAGDRIRVLNPALFRLGRQIAELGFSVDHLVGVLEPLLANTRRIAAAFVDMFLAAHWEPFVAGGARPERLPDLQRLIEQLQPVAAQAVVAAFQQAMADAAARALAGDGTDNEPAAATLREGRQ
jgi:DNA-binding transcriptional MerR regulator